MKRIVPENQPVARRQLEDLRAAEKPRRDLERLRPLPKKKRRDDYDEELYCPATPAEREFISGIDQILDAWRNFDAATQAAQKAKAALDKAVAAAPTSVWKNYQRFIDSGGCILEQYREWISGKHLKPLQPVPKLRHLRLVANKELPVRKSRPIPGPEAALIGADKRAIGRDPSR